MKVSLDWLKDYVDIDIPVKKLAEMLTMAGLEVESCERRGRDYVLGIEVTTNRPDWLSHIGIAREIAAVTGKKLRLPAVFTAKRPSISFPMPLSSNILSVEVLNPECCPRYTARLIQNVRIKPSPKWLVRRLGAMGVRSVNNVVDVTNYLLFETGQPLHAFDYDKLCNGKIMVRCAAKGERINTIDGRDIKLNENMLVIADRSKPVAVAGVIGGIDTEVTGDTVNILLEAASFDPIKIREVSKELAITTDSSYRFERGVDIRNIAAVSKRASELIQESAGGQELCRMADFRYERGFKNLAPVHLGSDFYRRISIRPEKVESMLGIKVSPQLIMDILRRLGFGILSSSKDHIRIEIPCFRGDVAREIDLIEEVARIYGYDNIPLISPMVNLPRSFRKDSPRSYRKSAVETEARARNILVSLSLNEIITHTLISEAYASRFTPHASHLIKLKNPLSGEHCVLRPALIPGLLFTIAGNFNKGLNDVRCFEIGPVYRKSGKLPSEPKHLGIAITGSRYSNWQMGTKPVDFFDIKGILERFFNRMGIKNYKFIFSEEPSAYFAKREVLGIELGGKVIGAFGRISDEALLSFDIKKAVYLAEFSFEEVILSADSIKTFKPLPRYPSIRRDVAVAVKKELSMEKIVALISEKGGELVRDVRLFDIYQGEHISAGYKGLAFSIEYRSSSGTLTDEEVNKLHSQIITELTAQLGAQIR